MKKLILSFFALAALSTALLAQNETPAKFKLYGFIRNYAIFDSREVKAGTEDLYFYMPVDENKLANGTDLNATPSFRLLSLTTRLGLDVSGYQFGSMKLNGKVEADFYCKSGSTAILRLRQAYIGLTWDKLGKNAEIPGNAVRRGDPDVDAGPIVPQHMHRQSFALYFGKRNGSTVI